MTPEQAKGILWARGETGFKLHAGQERINEAFERSAASRHLVFGSECSRQFGKTCWGVWLADKVARKYPRCSVRIGTAFYEDIEPFIMPAFRWLFADCPENLQPKFNAQKGRWLYANGSEIQLVGLDRNPNKLRGNRLRLILIEEAGFCDSDTLRYVYESVIIPATTHEPDARVVLISTPPESGSDHFFCQLVDEAATVDAYVKFTVYDNPLLSRERVDDIALKYAPNDPKLTREERVKLGKASIAFRREYLCERIVDARRAVIPEYDETRHVVESPRPDVFKFLHRYESLDSGVRDQSVVLLGYYDFPRAKLVIEDEVVLQGQEVDTRRIATEVRLKEVQHWLEGKDTLPVYRRVSDNDNLILVADLSREYDLHFTPTSKDSLEAMVNKVRLWFQDGKIEIHPRCKHLRGTLRTALWNKTRTDFERSPTYGHADALASLQYLVRNVDVHVNPVPPLLGIDRHNTLILPQPKRLSDAAKSMADAFGLPRR